VVDEGVAWADLQRAIASAEVGELESLEPIEVYRGPPVPTGKKSVALRLTFRSPHKTLTGEEADALQTRVLEALASQVGAVLRS